MAAVSQCQAAIIRPSTAHEAVLKLYRGPRMDDNPVLFAVTEASFRKRSQLCGRQQAASMERSATGHVPQARISVGLGL